MIEKLEAFLALARLRHFGRTAEELGITQPTLSAAIKQLEGELGVLLVNRGSRFEGLTAEGAQVLEWARRIVADARAMRSEMRAARAGLSGTLRIAAVPTALALVARLTEPLALKHPGLSFSVLSRTSLEILSLLGNLEVDAGITYLDREPLGRVLTQPLYRERYHFVTLAGGALAARDSVSWAEVARQPLCLLTPDMQNRRIIDRHLAEAGAIVHPGLTSNSMIVLMSHVRTGRWSSVMPLSVAESFGAGDGMRLIPIAEPDVSHTIGLIASPREPRTPLVTALIEQAAALAASEGWDGTRLR